MMRGACSLCNDHSQRGGVCMCMCGEGGVLSTTSVKMMLRARGPCTMNVSSKGFRRCGAEEAGGGGSVPSWKPLLLDHATVWKLACVSCKAPGLALENRSSAML